MTRATQHLVEEFDTLPDEERSELMAELARRIAIAPHAAPSDEDLVAAAEQLFHDLDNRERS